jgi:DNA-binding response OmpR family regulator
MNGPGKTILIVDDDERIRTALQSGLTLSGYQAVTQANGRLGLTWLDDHRPDLIILDVVMPEVDGLRFIGELRRRGLHPGVPVLVMSGDRDAQEQATALGADAFLSKPLQLSSVLGEAARLLGA